MKIEFILAGLLVVCFSFACSSNPKLEEGETVVAKIEHFKSENGRLPKSLADIGIAETESGPIYYKKESESKYVVWYGKELGESKTYDSETKKWK